jgi:peptidoglycan hydrolase-like protein with peptidoglycan-binding domain
MPKTLSIGSSGPEVQHVQTLLNLLPTLLPLLIADGVFGSKTKKRTVEFQQKSSLVPDGVIGPLTWGALLDLINKLFPGGPPGIGGGSDRSSRRRRTRRNRAGSLPSSAAESTLPTAGRFASGTTS